MYSYIAFYIILLPICTINVTIKSTIKCGDNVYLYELHSQLQSFLSIPTGLLSFILPVLSILKYLINLYCHVDKEGNHITDKELV
jgi:hypothetical protein